MRWSELQSLDKASPLAPDWLDAPRHVHIVGAGGIGMSALAHVLLAREHRVSGSDAGQNAQTASLVRAGATIYQGHESAR